LLGEERGVDSQVLIFPQEMSEEDAVAGTYDLAIVKQNCSVITHCCSAAKSERVGRRWVMLMLNLIVNLSVKGTRETEWGKSIVMLSSTPDENANGDRTAH
jgi:hypothetical protein